MNKDELTWVQHLLRYVKSIAGLRYKPLDTHLWNSYLGMLTALPHMSPYVTTRNIESQRSTIYYELYQSISSGASREASEEERNRKVWDLSLAISTTISRALTALIYTALAELDEGVVPISLELSKPADIVLENGHNFSVQTTWFWLACDSLVRTVLLSVGGVITTLNVYKWGDGEAYNRARRVLADLLLSTLTYDKWARFKADLKRAGKWQSNNVVSKTMKKRLDWDALSDPYVPHAILILMAHHNHRAEERVDGVLPMNKVTIEIDTARLVELINTSRVFLLPPVHKFMRKPFEDILRLAESADQAELYRVLQSLQALWRGWLGSAQLSDLAEASLNERSLKLVVNCPVERGRYFSTLAMQGLVVSRQAIHLFTHTAQILSHMAKERGLESTSKALGRLSPSRWASSYDTLTSVPRSPLPSIYDLMFNTQTVLMGMLYCILSDLSNAFSLEPQIPPDPMDLLRQHFGEVPEISNHPRYSESVECLRRAAGLPVALLEQVPLLINDMLLVCEYVAVAPHAA